MKDTIRDISVSVYKESLGPSETERMLAKDNDGGKKLRNRAASYDPLTRIYLRVLMGSDVNGVKGYAGL